MHTSLTVRRFRCFQNTTIEPLSTINLISGKNNVGKTALLEALWMHHGYFNPELGIQVSVKRGLIRIKTEESFHDLFSDFDVSVPIELVSHDEDGKSRELRIAISEPSTSRMEFRTDRFNGDNGFDETATDRISQESTQLATSKVELEFTSGDDPTIRSQAVLEPNAIHFERTPGIKEPTGIFLTSQQSGNLEELAERFANLAVTKQEQKIVRFLKIIEPRLQRLTVQYRGGLPVIYGDIDMPRLVPLPLMGQGMGRLLQIALAISDAKDGILLIDEVENGLHYTVMAPVWRAIAELAQEYRVQIFATTHSRECIDAARQAFVNISDVGFALHRLEASPEGIRAMTYDLDMLDAAIEIDAEVR